MAAIGEKIPWLIWPVVMILSTSLDALFCGMEIGLYSLNKIRLELRAEGGSRSARLLARMLRNPNNLLAILLVGTNLARYVTTFSLTSMFVLAGLADRAEWYTLAVATPLLFVLSDAGPKSIFRRRAEALVYRLAWLLRISHWVFNCTGIAPLVRAVGALPVRLARRGKGASGMLAHEALAAVVAEGRASGVITPFQSSMANRVMHLSEVTLRNAMIPMRSVVSVPTDVTREQLLQRIRQQDYSRLPMLDASGQVAGVLDILDVLTQVNGAPPAEKMAPPFVLSADASVSDALYRMRRARIAMAGVADEAGGHVGIVTMKDLVEEIVGELKAW